MSALKTLPATLISGYLGAGKSTLINHLLREADGTRITVLVNDFGEIAIDEELIANRSGDTLALTNGCMCCSIGGALYDAIDRILCSDPLPDHLLIETSGVADPAKIAQIAIAEPDLSLAGTVILVDAVNFSDLRNRKYLGDTVERQVACGDVLLISKADLVDAEKLDGLQTELRNLSPDAISIRITGGKISFDHLLDAIGLSRSNEPVVSSAGEAPHHHHSAVYNSWSFHGDAIIDPQRLQEISEPTASGIYRLKGFVVSPDGYLYEVQRAGTRFESTRSEEKRQGTRLVAIGLADEFNDIEFEKQWSETIKENEQP